MMSPHNNNHPSKRPVSDDIQISGTGSRKNGPQKPPEQSPKCPRCDSPNTKFCYYNNYSLTQPRHFCKTCRRYWTKGGALRNVPIGGGCRKTKKIKSTSRILGLEYDSSASSLDIIGGLNFFHGFSPSMEFQLGRLLPSSPIATNPPNFNIDASLMGFNGGIHGIGSMNVHGSLASSIESLSCMNQDLHWNLQQQRLAMVFGGENQKESSGSSTILENQAQKPQPIMFQNLEISKPEACAISNPENSNGNNSISNWNGIQVWNDLHQR